MAVPYVRLFGGAGGALRRHADHALRAYALSVAGLSLPIQAFCGSWLLFYLLVLEWRDRVEPWLREHGVGARHAFLALVACLLLQEAEGFSWFAAGNYGLATT